VEFTLEETLLAKWAYEKVLAQAGRRAKHYMSIMVVSWIEVSISMMMTKGSPFPFAELVPITRIG
jgi:hypothetical protein